MKNKVLLISTILFLGALLPCFGASSRTAALITPPKILDRAKNVFASYPGFINLRPLYPAFSVEKYTLAKGDTISDIAKARGISVETILSFNRIQSPRFIRFGQEIFIPSTDGILIGLDKPTPVAELVKQYDVRLEQFTYANGASIENGKIEGDVFLPGAKMDPKELNRILGVLLLWPTDGGRISSRFGIRNDPFTGAISRHKGVDIATYWGAPVYAAADGIVLVSAWDDVLGNYVRMNNGNGIVTVYGHMSSVKVKAGQKLARGQLIGRVGSTGYSTGPHLHFVAYLNGRLINPLKIFG